MNEYTFVIDTDQYAGNFERELTAYITGMLGVCEVGYEMSELFYKEENISDDNNPFSENITFKCEDGYNRPCAIYKSENGEYNSVAVFFDSKPTEEQIDIIKRRTKNFENEYKKQPFNEGFSVEILGFRLIKTSFTTEEIDV